MLRGRRDHRHRLGFLVPFAFASIAALMQPVVGHLAGMRLATQQPEKLAAMDLAVETRQNAPLTIGGAYVAGRARGSIDIPGVGSLLARAGFNRPVRGLNEFPVDDRPPVNIVHWSFQAMVALGTLLAVTPPVLWFRRRRGHDVFSSKWAMRLAVLAGPVAVLTLELGWVTTEVGRQPWMVYRVLRVRDSVTPNKEVWIFLATLVVVYTAMGVIAVRVLRSMAARWRAGDKDDLWTPYGPASK
jgi:cytochrome d ubiquinol oxidase subunit I